MIDFLVSLGLPRFAAVAAFTFALAGGLMTFFAVWAGFTTWLERRISAAMQSRTGPNRVGWQGLLQWIADAVKLIVKEEIKPEGADMTLYKMAPYTIVAGGFATFVVIPWGSGLIPADLDVGLLYFISITALVVVGILMAGWGSNNKWALIGGMRAAAQIVTYEIPVAMGLLPVILVTGSLSIGALMEAQTWSPVGWMVFHSPFTMLGFLIFLVGNLAESNRVPFDLPEAESELVAGFFTEYSGFRFAAISMVEFGGTWIVSAMTVAIFLGGGALPDTEFMRNLFFLPFLSTLVFLTKTLGMVFLLIWLRWTLPRFRIDQMMEFSWKYLLPLSFIAFFGEAIYMLLSYEYPMVQKGLSIVMFLLFGIPVFMFINRVRFNIKDQSLPVNSRSTDKYLTPKQEEPVAEAEPATEQ